MACTENGDGRFIISTAARKLNLATAMEAWIQGRRQMKPATATSMILKTPCPRYTIRTRQSL